MAGSRQWDLWAVIIIIIFIVEILLIHRRQVFTCHQMQLGTIYIPST
jgi:hypothetical protein